MATTLNFFAKVETFHDAGLVRLGNSQFLIKHSNKKFQNFQNYTSNLGPSVQFARQTLGTAVDGLVAQFTPVEQTWITLTADQQANASFNFTADQFIYNAEQFIKDFGAGYIEALSTKVETYAFNKMKTIPYRYYGNATNDVCSYQAIAQAITYHRAQGSPLTDTKVVFPDAFRPIIIGTGLGMFTPIKNDRAVNSWELGEFSQAEYYTSNIIKPHIAGTVGQTGSLLTVVSVNRNSIGGITSIVVSGAGAGGTPGVVLAGDVMRFKDGVSGKPDLRSLTLYGQIPTPFPVTMVSTTDVTVDALSGHATINISEPIYDLFSVQTGGVIDVNKQMRQTVNETIVAGMQIKVMPSHTPAYIISGNATFLAMPKMPVPQPYDYSTKIDEKSGVGFRSYWGSGFGTGVQGYIYDLIYGFAAEPRYITKILFPYETSGYTFG